MYIYTGQSHHPWKNKHSVARHVSPGIPTGFTRISIANYWLFKAVLTCTSMSGEISRADQPDWCVMEQRSHWNTHPNPSSGKSGLSSPEDRGRAGKSSRTDVHTWMGCLGEVPGNAHLWLMWFLVAAVRADVMWVESDDLCRVGSGQLCSCPGASPHHRRVHRAAPDAGPNFGWHLHGQTECTAQSQSPVSPQCDEGTLAWPNVEAHTATQFFPCPVWRPVHYFS